MSQTAVQTRIAGFARTPIGALMGELSGVPAADLGAAAIAGALAQSGVAGDRVEDVLMGNVLQAGQGQAPARQAAIKAGLPLSVGAVTLNKMCGSGMQALMLADSAIRAGDAEILVAGGMESMSRAPHLLARHRGGVKYGHDRVLDHMAVDGLEDAYEGLAMGVYADRIARERQIGREAQDAWALDTLARAQAAAADGGFAREIAPVTLADGRKIDTDELPRRAKPDRVASLKPAFSPDGTVTAANASAISDGAAALVLMSPAALAESGARSLARIVASATHAQAPAEFTIAPAGAIAKALQRAGWRAEDVDLWEINEAFAVVPILAERALGLDRNRINVRGGACALGHPIGASGARIVATLLAAMEARGARRGVASLCIGGGEATALCVERD